MVSCGGVRALVVAGSLGLSFVLIGAPRDLADAVAEERVYEQVSPTQKNAADVLPNNRRARAAADGNAVQFASLTGFGDVRGGGVATEYLAVRDPATGAWSTHGITPRQEASTIIDAIGYAFEPRYMGEFSPDLNDGVFMAKSPLTTDPNVAGAVNLYLRDDLRTPGEGHYQLLTSADTLQGGTPGLKPWFVAATADFSHVLFESQRNLTPDSGGLPGPDAACLLTGFGCNAARPKLYEWVNGTTRLVGILPNGDPTLSQAGQGAQAHRSYATGVLSKDGSRVIFTAPPPAFDGGQRGGILFVRDDHGTADTADDTSIQINASERTDCAGDPTCGGDGTPDPNPDPNPQQALYWAASRDCSVVYFSSDEQLTDAPGGGLYRFDLGAPTGQRLALISVDNEPTDGVDSSIAGVIGAAENGSYVYFVVTQNQLIAGGRTDPAGPGGVDARIFAWHNDTLREVGGIQSVDFDETVGQLGWSGRPKSSRVTPDGTHMTFVTRGTPELLSLFGEPEYGQGSCDEIGCGEIYVYDATSNGGTGGLQCASCNPTRVSATSSASFASFVNGLGVAADSSHLSHVLSDDGRYVFFNTAERLQPVDLNSTIDVYEFDTTRGQVALVSGGKGSDESVFLDASLDGSDVFFTTRDRLRSSDVDQSRDLYDARIGGIPDPGVDPYVPCAGDVCKPPASAKARPIQPPSVGSASASDVLDGPAPAAAFVVQPLSRRQRRLLASRGAVWLTMTATRPGVIRLVTQARLGGRLRVIQRVSKRIGRGGTTHVRLRLGHAARRELRQRHRLHVRVSATYSRTASPQTLHMVISA